MIQVRIGLTEWQHTEVPLSELTAEDARRIERHHGKKIEVDRDKFEAHAPWQLTPAGWVGVLPVHRDLVLSIQPKIPLGNLFRMLEVAYRLRFQTFEEITGCGSLAEFYERLANMLALRVLARVRRGLYRSYVNREERLACVRGRIDVARLAARPWDSRLRCDYEDHTADIDDNCILSGALWAVATSGLCSERVMPNVRQAYRSVAGCTTPSGVSPSDCLGRVYHRLNQDYQPMHALARFFLEHAGPTLDNAHHEMIPFVVNMPNLFEVFVAEWLRANLEWPWEVFAQYPMTFGARDELSIRIDLLLRDRRTGSTVAVMDTKYKDDQEPKQADVQQVVAYAAAQGCSDAVLIYPMPLVQPVDARWGKSAVRVRTLWFDLAADFDDAGRALVQQLTEAMGPAPTAAAGGHGESARERGI